MPLYHFDVSYDGQLSPDQDGTELGNVETAREEAIALVPELLKSRLPRLGSAGDLLVQVRDGQPDPLFTVRVSVALEDRT